MITTQIPMILSFFNILYYNQYCNNYNNTIIINIIKLLEVNERKVNAQLKNGLN